MKLVYLTVLILQQVLKEFSFWTSNKQFNILLARHFIMVVFIDLCSRGQVAVKIRDFRKPVRNSNEGRYKYLLCFISLSISCTVGIVYILLFLGLH